MPQLRFVFTTPGGFIRLSNIGRRMKSISELVIGKQWHIVTQGALHQSFHKSCPTWGRGAVNKDEKFAYNNMFCNFSDMQCSKQ